MNAAPQLHCGLLGRVLCIQMQCEVRCRGGVDAYKVEWKHSFAQVGNVSASAKHSPLTRVAHIRRLNVQRQERRRRRPGGKEANQFGFLVSLMCHTHAETHSTHMSGVLLQKMSALSVREHIHGLFVGGFKTQAAKANRGSNSHK